MPFIRSALIATAACLIGAAAYAQPAPGDASAPAGAPPASDSQSAPQTGNQPAPAGSPDMSSGSSAAPDTGAQPSTAPTAGSTAMPAPSDPGAAPTGAATNTSANVSTDANGTQVIASQPVPDTKANRAQYGKPLSRAGKNTAPAGN